MANLKELQKKYVIMNGEDIIKYLSLEEIIELALIDASIKAMREMEGKKENQYLIINTDEPYADEVIEIMKRNGHWR